MTTTSKCAEILLVVALAVLGMACERDDTPGRYSPGGEYFKQLDASGRKHIIEGDGDVPLGKLRVRDDEIKVYGADMQSAGTIAWSEGDDGVSLTVTPRGAESVRLKRPDDDVFELPDRFRIERVERGWVVFDAKGRRLGYVEEAEEGEYALRDDYSSPPRAYARPDDNAVKTPSGRTVVTARPEFRAAPLLGFAFDGKLDVLDRVAFGIWLERVKPAP